MKNGMRLFAISFICMILTSCTEVVAPVGPLVGTYQFTTFEFAFRGDTVSLADTTVGVGNIATLEFWGDDNIDITALLAFSRWPGFPSSINDTNGVSPPVRVMLSGDCDDGPPVSCVPGLFRAHYEPSLVLAGRLEFDLQPGDDQPGRLQWLTIGVFEVLVDTLRLDLRPGEGSEGRILLEFTQ